MAKVAELCTHLYTHPGQNDGDRCGKGDMWQWNITFKFGY
jgi:hypothetical protein